MPGKTVKSLDLLATQKDCNRSYLVQLPQLDWIRQWPPGDT
jgi:hypothetical protein